MAVLVDLNIAAAELLTRFLSTVTSRIPHSCSANPTYVMTHVMSCLTPLADADEWIAMLRWDALLQSVPEQEGGWASRLVEFYEGVLRSGEVLPPSGGLAQGMRQPSISADVYANILTGGVRPCHLFFPVDQLPKCFTSPSPIPASPFVSLLVRPNRDWDQRLSQLGCLLMWPSGGTAIDSLQLSSVLFV